MTWRYPKGVVLSTSGLALALCFLLIMYSLPNENDQRLSLERPAGEGSHDTRRSEALSVAGHPADERSGVAAAEESGTIEGADLADPSTHPADRAASVHGEVVDAISGAPVREFRVFYLPAGEGDILEEAARGLASGFLRNDLEGHFRLTDLPEGTYAVLIDPAASGYEKTVIHEVVVPRTQLLVARVGRGAHVEGRLLDALGRPVPDVEVILGRASSPGEESPAYSDGRTTDKHGGFLFTRLPVGEYRLSTVGTAQEEMPAFSVGVNARVEKDLRLPIANALFISVMEPAGKPVEGADVLLASRGGLRRRAVTDAKGEARVWALPGDRQAVRTNRAGYRVDNQVVDMGEVGDRVLRVVLTRTGG